MRLRGRVAAARPALAGHPRGVLRPFDECANARERIEGIEFLVRPLRQGNAHKPQWLPAGRYAEGEEDFVCCRLFSVVAWDPVSWPGNDYYGGARCTDDGVKAAATSAMRALTGVEGRYDPLRHAYLPPGPYPTWEAVVVARRLQLTAVGKLSVLG